MPPSKFSCLLSVIVVFNLNSVQGICEKTFITTCENLPEVEFNKTKQTWTELLVQYPFYEEEIPPSFILSNKHLNRDVSNLKWLIIIGQLTNIDKSAFTYTKSLEHLLLYKNNLPTILPLSFKNFKNLQKLGLTNNFIKRIERYAFYFSRIGTIDLSHNELTALKKNIFKKCPVTRLIITNNKLQHIDNGCLPTSLEVLNLDYNNFKHIPDELKNLNQLTEFTISHNHLVIVDGSEWSTVSSLKRLDLSFNTISVVDGSFDELSKLEFLNLAQNDLEQFHFTPTFQNHTVGKQFILLLANNRLRNLLLPTIPQDYQTQILLTLSGNPWNCCCIKRIEQGINEESGISRTQCDKKIVGCGKIPYCVAKDVNDCEEDELFYEIENFRNMLVDAECDVFNNVNIDS